MITVHTVAELREHVANARRSGQRVGFVPTMGNLHAGHISLIDRARSECEFVVASIFVNPLQFNDKSDLQRYPRTLPDDQQKLAQAQCNLLFAPNVEEMYPNGQESQSIVHVPVVSEGLCGGSRPGHFDGVSTVVTKLFNQVLADKAFLGEKDFQQVAVIRKMVNDLCMPIEVVTVPTARAEDGLALSSRNGYLSTEERALATGLYQTLNDVIAALNAGAALNSTLNKAEQDLEKRGFKPDYIEVRRSKDLAPATTGDDEIVVLGAAFLGSARLIDNIAVTLNRKID